jgi:hypothetical protein
VTWSEVVRREALDYSMTLLLGQVVKQRHRGDELLIRFVLR